MVVFPAAAFGQARCWGVCGGRCVAAAWRGGCWCGELEGSGGCGWGAGDGRGWGWRGDGEESEEEEEERGDGGGGVDDLRYREGWSCGYEVGGRGGEGGMMGEEGLMASRKERKKES